MTARDQQRGESKAMHACSVAQLFAVLQSVAVLAACAAEPIPQDPIDPNDLDGDGVPNADDLCPRSAGVSQHDEDGDRVGDACDVCPSVADPAQSDAREVIGMQFEDGIGDACDPRGTFSGDLLGAFFTFSDPAQQLPWRGTGWTIADDAAHATGDASWHHAIAIPGDGIYAEARVAVGVDGDDTTLGHTCAIVRDRNADGSDELEITVYGTTDSKELGATITSGVLTTWRVIDRERLGRVFCRIAIGRDSDELVLASDDGAIGRYAFASRGATSTVESLVVYTFPVNPCAFETRCEPAPEP
jgi:hypothetical protein